MCDSIGVGVYGVLVEIMVVILLVMNIFSVCLNVGVESVCVLIVMNSGLLMFCIVW